jgi:hypothetical protein
MLFMITALACVALLGLPADKEGDQLQIVNPRSTYGYLGPQKTKSKGILPGDVAHFSFGIKGLKMDAAGHAAYSMLMEVLDDKGDLHFKLGPTNSTAQCCLGGDTFLCSANLVVPLDTKPGIHTLRVTIRDRATDKSATFAIKGNVLARDFGLVRVGLFADQLGKVPAPPVGVPGQVLFVNFSAVGFERNKTKGQPDIEVSLKLLDDKGKPTLEHPLKGRANADVPENLHLVPMQFGLTLTRVGRFTVQLSATDRHNGKTAQVSFPIRVVASE